MLTLIDALRSQRSCACNCHNTLSPQEKLRGVRALYHLDDALRGWGYKPNYERHGDSLFREAAQKNDPTYWGVAVRFGECVYRRLVGSMVHECLHGVFSDTSKPNFGLLWSQPYSFPTDMPEGEITTRIEDANFCEARAWVGVWILGRAMFEIDWNVRTARDIGTYCFTGGNALVPSVKGCKPIAHLDRTHHAERYYTRGRAIEDNARAWFAIDENMKRVRTTIDAAAVKGKASRKETYPDPDSFASMKPHKIGRNDPCICGTREKYKDCCGKTGQMGYLAPSLSR